MSEKKFHVTVEATEYTDQGNGKSYWVARRQGVSDVYIRKDAGCIVSWEQVQTPWTDGDIVITDKSDDVLVRKNGRWYSSGPCGGMWGSDAVMNTHLNAYSAYTVVRKQADS